MIKFFRKIRQNILAENKLSKYLLYAIGEIILVVIGILIALQVNTWNENRKFKKNEKELLENMLSNLNTDSIFGTRMLRANKSIDSLHYKLYQIGTKGLKDVHFKNPNNIRQMSTFLPITKNNDPFIMDKLKNKRIRSEIVNYFSELDQVDKYIEQLRPIMVDGMRAYLRKKAQHDLTALFEQTENALKTEFGSRDYINIENLKELSKEIEFQQLLFEAHVKLTEYTQSLTDAMLQNEKLKKTILEELKSNY